MPARQLTQILEELTKYSTEISQEELDTLCTECMDAKRIFVAGAGRSGVVVRALANRLLHIGFSVHVVGNITTPPVDEDDLLLICSGSGETRTLVSYAQKAAAEGCRIALVTQRPDSTVGQLADVITVVPGTTPKTGGESSAESLQPMASLFEQMSFLLFDAAILELMERLGETTESMFARHATLE